VGTDAEHELARVVEPSGRFVFRVWFGETFHPRQKVADELTERGALLEWSSANLLAVDAPNGQPALVIAGYLAEQERTGRLTFETSGLRVRGGRGASATRQYPNCFASLG
jgi:Domain of unknown function (DUF4265)